jgi:monofunctional biosynthetic peptidoglycan transglycosylase
MLKSNPGRILLRLFLKLVLLVLLVAAGVAGYWMATGPDVSRLATKNPPSTSLIDDRIAEAREQGLPLKPDQNWVPLSHISPHLQRAVIISEDASFYHHDGFDWEGIREAAVRNLEEGKLQRGGSTITQQLAKNLYLSTEKNLLRKVNEALITWSLEQRLTKQRILELYLNVVEWGRHVYGAEAAARHHFGKSAKDLSPDEAALLTAILPAPRQHDPLEMTPYLAKRQQWILNVMEQRYGIRSVVTLTGER